MKKPFYDMKLMINTFSIQISIFICLILFTACPDEKMKKTTAEDQEQLSPEMDSVWRDRSEVELSFVGRFTELVTKSEIPFLNKPSDIDVDSYGNYYILEAGNHRILKYDRNFNYLGSFGRRGRGPGEFLAPSAIEIDHSDNIYVGDNMHERLLVFKPEGELKKSIRIKGHEMYFKIIRDGNIYVNNPIVGYAAGAQEFSLLHILDSTGKFLSEIGEGVVFEEPPLSNGGNRFRFDVDQYGNVCIVFLFQNRIEKYNAQGETIFSIKRDILEEMLLSNKRDAYYALSEGVSFDEEGRIWNIERVHRPPKYSSGDIKNALVASENGLITIDPKMLPKPKIVDQYAIDMYDQDGVFMCRHNMYHYCSNIRILGDRLFVFDKNNTMDIFIYQIIEM